MPNINTTPTRPVGGSVRRAVATLALSVFSPRAATPFASPPAARAVALRLGSTGGGGGAGGGGGNGQANDGERRLHKEYADLRGGEARREDRAMKDFSAVL